uniref:AAA+ ATPase domain-containing protein n=1 Tax=Plectus sambesii TaxID=2011161 RepID=A0A914WMN5_9BILA
MANFSINQADDPADAVAFRTFVDSMGDDDDADSVACRILPRSLVGTDLNAVNKTLESLNPTAVYLLSDAKTASTKVKSLVALIKRDNQTNVAVLLVVLPRRLISSLNEYAWIAKCLEKRGRHAIVANEVRSAAHFDDFSWITCESVAKSRIMPINKLILQVNPGAKTDQLVSRLFQMLREKCGSFPLVLTVNGLWLSVTLGDESVTDCKLLPDISDGKTQDCVFLLFPDCLPSVTVTESESESDSPVSVDEPGKVNFAENLSKTYVLQCQAGPVAESARFIEWTLQSEVTVGRHVLLCGPASSGKTSMAYRICSRLFRGPATVFSYRLDCRTLRGKNVDSIKKRLNAVLDTCKQRRPSVLVLDDLDQLCSTPNAVEELNPGSDIATERLVQAVWSCVDGARVLVLATSRSAHSLHSTLVAPRGRHFFGFRRFIEPLEHVSTTCLLPFFANTNASFVTRTRVTRRRRHY